MRADAEGDAVGLPVGDAHAAIIDAQRLGGDLRHHGFKPLADRGAAGDELDAPAVGRAKPTLLDEHGKTRADSLAARAPARELALELLPFEAREKLVEKA